MIGGKARAMQYRKHAKEIRHAAHDVRGEWERRMLLSAAKEFEQLADELEAGNSN